MVPVAAGASGQHLLGEQGLPPGGNQPPGVKVRGMHRPQPHAGQFFGVAGVKNWNT